MRPTRNLTLLAVLLLPVVSLAQSTVILDLQGTEPGIYYYSIQWDGSTARLVPIRTVVQVGNGGAPTPSPQPSPSPFVPPVPQPQPSPAPRPPPLPTPQPPAPLESVEVRVQDVTQQALAGGGSVKTAVFLQRVYNIVSGALDTNQIPKEKAVEAIRTSTDIALEQQGETPKWTAWRASVSSIIAEELNAGRLSSKEQWVGLLRRIEMGVKNVVNTAISTDRTRDLKEADYEQIIKFQQRVIDAVKGVKVAP